jgi:hypothetical protein
MRIHSLAVAALLLAINVDTTNSLMIPGSVCRHKTRTGISHNGSLLLPHPRKRRATVKGRNNNSRKQLGMISHSSSSSLLMADSNNDDVNVTPTSPKTKLTRTQQRIQQLQADIENVETNREKFLQQIVEAEQRREQLEQEAANALQEAQLRKEQLEKLQKAQVVTGTKFFPGGFTGEVVPIAAVTTTTATIGGLAAARTVLQQRQKKLAEQQKRLEEERIAKERAALKAKRQQGVAGNFLLVSSL